MNIKACLRHFFTSSNLKLHYSFTDGTCNSTPASGFQRFVYYFDIGDTGKKMFISPEHAYNFVDDNTNKYAITNRWDIYEYYKSLGLQIRYIPYYIIFIHRKNIACVYDSDVALVYPFCGNMLLGCTPEFVSTFKNVYGDFKVRLDKHAFYARTNLRNLFNEHFSGRTDITLLDNMGGSAYHTVHKHNAVVGWSPPQEEHVFRLFELDIHNTFDDCFFHWLSTDTPIHDNMDIVARHFNKTIQVDSTNNIATLSFEANDYIKHEEMMIASMKQIKNYDVDYYADCDTVDDIVSVTQALKS